MVEGEQPIMRARRRRVGLWGHADFLRLWAGETVSFFGIQVTALALPLTAAVSLGATPFQMGLLGALQTAASLVIGPFAGVWVDRLRRRPILIATNALRAVALGTIPLAAALGLLRMPQLYLVAFLSGAAGVFFVVAYQSFLGTLLAREELVEGNSKLRLSEAVAQVAGPSVGGLLVGLVTAPLTLAISAVAPLASVVLVGQIRATEPPPVPPADRRGVGAEIGEGLRLVAGHPLLRPVLGSDALGTFFDSTVAAVYILYATRDLGLAPEVLGAIMAVGGPMAFVGALLAGRIVRAAGLGPTLIGAGALIVSGTALVPLAAAIPSLAVAALVAWRALAGLGAAIYSVNFYAMMQAVPPARLQGRANATARVFIWGAMALGSLAGGALGQWLGLRPTLVIAAVGMLAAPIWLLLSPARGLREMPGPLGAG